ncbi:MAG: transglycosylase SLT domain-containing protein [bacterium]|nr:transglycosylase SLT domain-containing protein [bacterium]
MRFFYFFLAVLAAGVFIGGSAHAETTGAADAMATSTAVIVVEEPVLLQMMDGRFYHPASGKIGSTRAEALCLIAGESFCGALGVIVPPVAPSPAGNTVSSPPTETVLLAFPLKEAIDRAKTQIQAMIDEAKKKNPKPKVLTVDNGWRDVTVAMWDPASDGLTFSEIQKSGTKVKMKSGPGVRITYTNGINSTYEPTDGSDKVIVAIRYQIYAEKVISKKKKQYTVSDAIYTPYSPRLATPEMVAYGRYVLDQHVSAVYADLRQLGIRSWAYPDRALVDVIEPDLAKTIAVIEHVDEHALAKNLNATVNGFFTILAGNPDTAYAYSKSSASALGLVQFIPSTYKSMVTKRPELKLNPNFEAGMRDMPNALKAQVAYLDTILRDLPPSVRETYLQDEGRDRVQEYMTAAYNGGTSRIKKAIAVWDDIWTGDLQTTITTLQKRHNTLAANVKSWKKQLTKAVKVADKTALKKKIADAQAEDKSVSSRLTTLQASALRKETMGYIAKYRKVIDVIAGKAVILAASK